MCWKKGGKKCQLREEMKREFSFHLKWDFSIISELHLPNPCPFLIFNKWSVSKRKGGEIKKWISYQYHIHMELTFFRSLGGVPSHFSLNLWEQPDSSCSKDGTEHTKLKPIPLSSFNPKPRYIYELTWGGHLGFHFQMFSLSLVPLSSKWWWKRFRFWSAVAQWPRQSSGGLGTSALRRGRCRGWLSLICF